MKILLMSLVIIYGLSYVTGASLIHDLIGKHFKKEKKDEPKVVHRKCDIIWEEKVTPLCKSVNHPHCHTEWRDECHKEWDTNCWEIQVDQCNPEKQCKTEWRDECHTEWDNNCREVEVNECTSEKKCEWTTEKKCNTEYTVTCDDHHHRKKRDVELPEDIAEMKLETLDGEDVSDPMLTRHVDITDMSDEDIAQVLQDIGQEQTEDGSTEESPHSRKKRGIKKIKKIFKKLVGHDDKKDEPVVVESLCHHHPDTKCWDEPKENCWDEPICHKVPKEKCEKVPRDVCEKVDFEKCWTESVCHKVPQQKCEQVPRDVCNQVDYQKCEDVWEEECEYMRVKVAKKHCRKGYH